VTSALFALASCTSTVDSVGYNGTGGAGGSGLRLRKLTGPTTYPNPFKDLEKTDEEVADKIARTWGQLFYGDPGLQAIYVPESADQSSILDTLHMDKRTEGIGLAMMIAVQLDKRTEFDRLWNYANEQKKVKDGARRGYFESWCDTPAMTTMPCDDPYGEQQMLMALIFAHDRWGSTTTINYEAGALELLTVMRHKQDENGGVVDGITNTFDKQTALPFHLPQLAVAQEGISRPSIVMPAYYDLWAEATDDPFWTRAARAARDYWKRVAHPETGLTPVRADFGGDPVALWENFQSESYRAQINMALDWAWAKGEKDEWLVDEAKSLLTFFSKKGIATYAGGYSLDGTEVIDPMRDQALVVANGVTGMVAGIQGAPYVNAVFDMATPTGPARYYSGILDLTALLILSGQYRVW
jgi:oligosaccharide reducing-end xylanase